VRLGDKDGLCTLGGIYRVVEEDLVGNIKNIQQPKDKPWFGFIGPIEEKDSNTIFGVVSTFQFQNNSKEKSINN
jgi:hypothetical protein